MAIRKYFVNTSIMHIANGQAIPTLLLDVNDAAHDLFHAISIGCRIGRQPSRLKLRIVAKSPNTEQIDRLQKPAVSLTTGKVRFVPISYNRAGRGGVSEVPVKVFSVSYRETRTVKRTIRSLATTCRYDHRSQPHPQSAATTPSGHGSLYPVPPALPSQRNRCDIKRRKRHVLCRLNLPADSLKAVPQRYTVERWCEACKSRPLQHRSTPVRSTASSPGG